MKYIIRIPEPCNEKWSEMTPTERGRYCKVCQKEIYDFTQMSKFDLVRKLDKGKNVCGRFKKSQLDVELDSLKDVSYLGRIALFFGLTSLVSVATQPVYANPVVNTPVQFSDTIIKPQNEQLNDIDKSKDFITIKGKVFSNRDSLWLPGVCVSYANNLDTILATTNIDGEFCIEIPSEKFAPDIELHFSSIGIKEYKCFVDKNTQYFEVIMEDDNQLMGEVIVVGYSRPTLWQRIKNIDCCTIVRSLFFAKIF